MPRCCAQSTAAITAAQACARKRAQAEAAKRAGGGNHAAVEKGRPPEVAVGDGVWPDAQGRAHHSPPFALRRRCGDGAAFTPVGEVAASWPAKMLANIWPATNLLTCCSGQTERGRIKCKKALARFGCKHFLRLIKNRGFDFSGFYYFWFLQFPVLNQFPKTPKTPDKVITRIPNFSSVT